MKLKQTLRFCESRRRRTYNVAIRRPVHEIPFDCDVSVVAGESFCRSENTKDFVSFWKRPMKENVKKDRDFLLLLLHIRRLPEEVKQEKETKSRTIITEKRDSILLVQK